jgi:outer membrane protein assembly factor BamD (BamD/ComL family)
LEGLEFLSVSYTSPHPESRMSSTDDVTRKVSQTTNSQDQAKVFLNDFPNARLYTGHILYIYNNVVKVIQLFI